ncbi:hypothetical protein [Sandarakinorhabdus sp.]|uniref:hypothetical protein n=1 Tax=Sandarakinorhabdus sp. TaxID=1916663 RepID=UPI0033400098
MKIAAAMAAIQNQNPDGHEQAFAGHQIGTLETSCSSSAPQEADFIVPPLSDLVRRTIAAKFCRQAIPRTRNRANPL